jgi:hypothetical protein
MKPIRSFIVIVPLALVVVGGPIASWADSAQPDSWAMQCVDCPKYFGGMTDRSLRLDDAGYPHIAYGGGHLYYAWRDGSGWHYETADPAPMVGGYASLALDGNGYPHISYQDVDNGDLKYAYKDGAGWHVETAESSGDVGYFTSLALDTSGYPHISHTYSWGSLYYTYKDASGWHTDNPDSGIEVDDT